MPIILIIAAGLALILFDKPEEKETPPTPKPEEDNARSNRGKNTEREDEPSEKPSPPVGKKGKEGGDS